MNVKKTSNKIKKILFSIPNSGFSGAEKQLLFLAIGLRERGYNITLCNLDREGLFTNKSKESGFECIVIPRNSSFDLKRIFNYGRFIRKNKFDIILSFTYSANNLTRLIRFIFPFTKFYHIAGERGRFFEGNKFRNLIDSLLSKKSNVIVFNSKFQSQKLLSVENISPKKVCVIHNGVDFKQSENIVPMNLYNEFSIPMGNRVICSIGNLTSPKNIPMFIEIAENILSKNNNMTFIYIGDSQFQSGCPKLRQYRRVIQKKNLNEKVLFLGYQDNIISILKACFIFVLTSKQEGMPNALIEAIIANVPVVSTNVDGVPELIIDGYNGFLVKSKDANKMIEKINQLLHDDNLRYSFCKNALKTAKYMFDMNKMIDSYEKILLQNYKN